MSNTFTATAEQSAILTAVQNGQSLIVNAFAGAGKSSTLRYIAQSMPAKFLYLVFGRQAADDANSSFPDNVKCQTFHGLAYSQIMTKAYKSKFIKFWDIGKCATALGDHKREFTGKVVNILQEYCKTDFDDICQTYPIFQDYESPESWEFLLPKAQLLWNSIVSESGQAPITFDVFLKLYQLQKPVLSNFDIIMVDEAQDMNPVQIDILKQQTQQKVLVGDHFQAIYAWRGAINAMSEFSHFDTYYLTESFRFGKAIADDAAIALRALGATLPIIGRGTKTEIEKTAILIRSNFGLFMEMINLSKQGKYFYAEKDTSELFNQIYTASAMRYSFKAGKAPDYGKYPNKKIQSFFDWKGLLDSNDSEVKQIVRLIECGYGHTDIELIKQYLVKKQTDTDTIIVSGHKSKGLEYDKVIICADFLPWDYDEYSREKIKQFIQDQGLNLLYVGLTRAKVEVQMSDEVRLFLTNDLIRYRKEIGEIGEIDDME